MVKRLCISYAWDKRYPVKGKASGATQKQAWYQRVSVRSYCHKFMNAILSNDTNHVPPCTAYTSNCPLFGRNTGRPFRRALNVIYHPTQYHPSSRPVINPGFHSIERSSHILGTSELRSIAPGASQSTKTLEHITKVPSPVPVVIVGRDRS